MPLYRGSRRLILKRKVSAAVVATTTWNPSDKAAPIVLSGGNLTATWTSGSGFDAVRAIASHSTGKFYCEFTNVLNNSAIVLGIENASQSLTGPVGDGTAGVQYNPFNGQIVSNFTIVSTIQTSANGDVICMAVDLGATLIWIRTNGGNWNNSGAADPATGAGGASFSAITSPPYYPAWAGHDGPPNDAVTANFGGSAYAQSVPAGFGNW